MNCPQCDRIIPDGAAECPYCGIIIKKFVQRELPKAATSAKKSVGRGKARIRVSAADEAWHRKQAGQRFVVGIVLLCLLIVGVGYMLRPKSQLSVVTVPEEVAPQQKELPDQQVVAVTLEDMISRFVASEADPADVSRLMAEQRRMYDHIRGLIDSQRFGEAAEASWDVLHGEDREMMRAPALVHAMGRAFVAAGVLYYRFKLWPEAFRYLDAARVCAPDHWFYYKYLGIAAFAIGREADGRRYSMKYLTHRGEDIEMLSLLMDLSVGMEHYNRAARYAGKIVSLQPGHPRAEETYKLLTAVMNLPPGRRPARTTDMQVFGFTIKLSKPLPYGVAADFGETLSHIRDRAQKILGLDEMPVIDIIFRDTEGIRDFARSLNGCQASRQGSILIPQQGFHPAIAFVREALLNAYVQAVLYHLSNHRIPCWVAHGIAAWAEKRNGHAFPEGGMHNLPPLLSMKMLQTPKHLLTPADQNGYYEQCYAAVSVMIQEQGIEDVMECVATVKTQDWMEGFLECADMDNDEILEALMARFGGRRH